MSADDRQLDAPEYMAGTDDAWLLLSPPEPPPRSWEDYRAAATRNQREGK